MKIKQSNSNWNCNGPLQELKPNQVVTRNLAQKLKVNNENVDPNIKVVNEKPVVRKPQSNVKLLKGHAKGEDVSHLLY